MLFQTPLFFWFFLCVLAFTALLSLSRPGPRRLRNAGLLVASYLFYASWDPRFLALICASTLLDYLCGLRIAAKREELASEQPRAGLGWLVLSLTGNLGVLACFKYANWFLTSLHDLGLDVPALNLLLPVGISFFTFQSMSYTIDIYRGQLRPTRSLLDFALFVAFFPQLVAGPIVRARDFLPQLQAFGRRFKIRHGLFLIARGAFKKICVSDLIADYPDQVFAAPAQFPPGDLWLAAALFSIQIYCDFSGYTDMAMGVARMLGFRLPENFANPYTAISVQDFWRRWHISLSAWLRDYLYIPLGGNRRLIFSVMLTMLLGGLWHGAGLNFIIWGGLHGLAILWHRAWRARVAPALEAAPAFARPDRFVYTTLAWLATQLLVLLCWVFFRAETAAEAVAFVSGMFGLVSPASSPVEPRLFTSGSAVLLAAAIGFYAGQFMAREVRSRSWKRRLLRLRVIEFAYLVVIALVCLYLSGDTRPFIYFQF